MSSHVAIVGGGLVGCVAAMFLADRGHRVTIVERRPDPRDADLAGGRSINLTLCERGWAALGEVDAEPAVRRLALPAAGRDIHHADGERSYQPYGPNGEAIWSISRNALNRTLLDLATARPGVTARFGLRCQEVDLDAPAVAVSGDAGRERIEADVLIGADGAFSAVRRRLVAGARCECSEDFVDQGYKELTLPAAPGGGWRLDPRAIHIWPRGRFMLIGFANLDGSFTLSLHLPFEGETSFASLTGRRAVERLFDRAFPDLEEVADRLVEDVLAHPVSSMVTVRCSPWSRGGKVALIGDAAHAIVPSYGQGANSGFEDCRLLAGALDDHGGDWGRALAAFETARKPDADAIADVSLAHFHEIRDLVDDASFLRRKEVERSLSALYPGVFVPLYEAISFTTLPYRQAVERERRQRALVDRVLALDGIAEALQTEEARRVLDPLVASFREEVATR